MATDKNILKGWFSNYKKPTQEQFWAWLESYWHKGEKIPVSELEGLNELLAAVQTPIVTDTYLIQVSLQGNKLRLVMSNEQVFEVDLSAVVGSGGGGITSVQWNDIQGKPIEFTPTTHTHIINEVNGLQEALNNKADINHSHNWNDIQGKPSEFTPTTHTHIISDVNGLQGALNNKADVNHSHVINWDDIQGKPTNLGNGGIPAQHTHAIADITNLQQSLDNKANVNHNHNWNDIQGKPNEFTPTAHTHPISQVTGLQNALNNKADVNHSHTLEPLEITTTTQLNATHNNRILIIKGNISLTLSEGGSAGFTGCGIDVVEGKATFGVSQGITLTGFSVAELNKDEKGYVYRMKQGENNFRLV